MSTTDIDGVLRLQDGEPAVHFERRYATDPADLWSAVTEPDRLARWFQPVSGDLVPGGRYRVDFGPDGVTDGTVRACDPPRALELTWNFPGERESLLRVGVRDGGERGGAVLVLDHRRLPADQAVGYGAGWHVYLDQLNLHLDGVTALPDWGERWSQVVPDYRAQAAVWGAQT